MAENHDKVALNWVKSEVEQTLSQAQNAIKSFAENEADVTQIHFCVNCLHQVAGTMQMLEFYAAAMLAEEMEAVATALGEDEVISREQSFEVLLSAIQQFQSYLARYGSGAAEQPMLLLPILNDLRTCRKEDLLSAGTIFTPRTEGVETPALEPLLGASDEKPQLKHIRQQYQQGLVQLLRSDDGMAGVDQIRQAVVKLRFFTDDKALSRLWWVAEGFVSTLDEEEQYKNVAVQGLLGQIDRLMRTLSKGEEIDDGVREDLLKNLLYYVAKSESEAPLVKQIRNGFGLVDSLPTDKELEVERQALKGPDAESVRLVVVALKEEIAGIKDSLDIHLRSGATEAESVEELAVSLQRLADTLVMLGLGRERQMVLAQIGELRSIRDDNLEPEEVMLGVAQALLEIEAVLDDMKPGRISQEDDGERELPQLKDAKYQFVRECRNKLQHIKEVVSDYYRTRDADGAISELPEQLREMERGLKFIGFDRLALTVGELCKFKEQLLSGPWALSDSQQILLADAISSIDYYLEGMQTSELSGLPSVMVRAEESIVELYNSLPDEASSGEQEDADSNAEAEAPVSDSQTEMPDAEAEEAVIEAEDQVANTEEQPAVESTREVEVEDEPEVDDEIREIFVEEVNEVLETLNEELPKWRRGEDSGEALASVRRAFHTLKGSGRMVGAKVIGETGWAIENMLNRLLEGAIDQGADLESCVVDTVAILPQLVTEFAEGQRSTMPAELVARAEAVSRGEDVSALQTGATSETQAKAESFDAALEESGTPEVEDEAVWELAPEMLEIFRTEAEGHISTLEIFAQQLGQGITRCSVSDQLLRSLHTLKGAARTARFEQVAELISPMENYFQELKARHQLADEQDMQMLGETQFYLRDAVSEQPMPAAELDARFAHLSRVLDQRQKLLHEAPISHVDESARDASDLLPFLEATGQILDALAEISAIDESDDVRLAAIRSQASTIRSLAQKADHLHLEEMENLLAALYQFADQQELGAEPQAYWQLLNSSVAHGQDLLSRLVANQTLVVDEELLAGMDNWQPADAVPETAVEETAGEETAVEEQATPEQTAEELAEPAEPGSSEEVMVETDGQAGQDTVEATTETEETEPSVDEEIVGLFVEEAEELIESDADLMRVWHENPDDLNTVAELQRNLHTLKGSARMAGFGSIGDLAHEMEELYSAIAHKMLDATPDAIALAERAQDRLLEMFAHYRDPEKMPDGNALIEELQAYIHDSRDTVEAGEAEPVIDTSKQIEDHESLDIFLAEGQDILAEMKAGMAVLVEDHQHEESLRELARQMQELHKGAEFAGLESLATLATKMQHLLTRIADQPELVTEELIGLTQTGISEVSGILDEAAEVRTQSVPEQFLRQLDDAEDELDKATAAIAGAAKEEKTVHEGMVPVNVVPFIRRKGEKDAEDSQETRQDSVRIAADVLDGLVNLASEAAVYRARLEQQMGAMSFNIEEMESTVDRLREQLRKLEIETEAQVLYRRETSGLELDDFDPLEMDRYTRQQELARSLSEAASDLINLKDALAVLLSETETITLQQGRAGSELQERLTRTRMVPFSGVESRLRRMVRKISDELGKKVDLKIHAEGEMDRTVLERMVAPMEHMLRNAIDHGIESAEVRKKVGKKETGQVEINLYRRGADVLMEIADDGRGIDLETVRKRAVERELISASHKPTKKEAHRLILQPGFSTAEKVTQISGRGVGMDVVNSEILQLGGQLDIDSELGEGSRFSIRLPFTVTANQALMVKIKGEIYALPLTAIAGVSRLAPDEITEIYEDSEKRVPYAGQDYQLRYLGQLLDRNSGVFINQTASHLPVLFLQGKERLVAVQVDELLGSREIVVKSIGRQLATVPGLTGATILGDGSVVLILDMPTLSQRFEDSVEDTGEKVQEVSQPEISLVPTVMVVDDSITVRKVTARLLQRNGYQVMTAKDGVDAVTQLHDRIPDIMLLDIEMPRMDGFELATVVRHDEKYADLPIIMITSRTGQKHRDRAESIGVDRYLGKPFDEEGLLESIEELLSAEKNAGAAGNASA